MICMKLFYSFFLILFAISVLAIPADAQISRTGVLIYAGADDANVLYERYVRPNALGFGSGANAGIINTATSKGVFEIEVQLLSGIVYVPKGEKQFDVTRLDLNNASLVPGSNPNSPSVIGKRSDRSRMEVLRQVPGTGEEISLNSFRMPDGSGLEFLVTPSFQISVGIPYDTEIILRLMPELDLGRLGNYRFFGFGLKHNVNNWFTDPLPFDLTFSAGYNFMGLSGDLDVTPQSFDIDPNGFDDDSNWRSQKLNLGDRSWNINAVAGTEIDNWSLFGGLGYMNSSFSLDASGKFPINELAIDEDGNGLRELTIIEDPVDVSINSPVVIRFFGGATYNLGITTLSAEFSYSDYLVLNVGMGIKFNRQ